MEATKQKSSSRQKSIVRGLRRLMFDKIKEVRDLPVDELSRYHLNSLNSQFWDTLSAAQSSEYFDWGKLEKIEGIYSQIKSKKSYELKGISWECLIK